jgi:hypothetical protein
MNWLADYIALLLTVIAGRIAYTWVSPLDWLLAIAMTLLE